MEQIIAVLQMPLRQQRHGSHKEQCQSEQIGQASPFIELSSLNLKDADTVDDFHRRLISVPQSDDVDLVSPFRQSICIPTDAVVIFIEGIGHHADSHVDSLKGRSRETLTQSFVYVQTDACGVRPTAA